MSRRAARPGQDRASLYQQITDKITTELEGGRVPWVQPWGTQTAKASLAMPKNAASGRQYSGIIVLILRGAVIEHGFSGQSWLTFGQFHRDESPIAFRTRRGRVRLHRARPPSPDTMATLGLAQFGIPAHVWQHVMAVIGAPNAERDSQPPLVARLTSAPADC